MRKQKGTFSSRKNYAPTASVFMYHGYQNFPTYINVAKIIVLQKRQLKFVLLLQQPVL